MQTAQVTPQQQCHCQEGKTFIFTDYSTSIGTSEPLMSRTHTVQKMGNCFFSSWKVEPFQVKRSKKQDRCSNKTDGKMLPPATPIQKQKKTQTTTPKKLCLSFVLNTATNTPQTATVKDCCKAFEVALRLNQNGLCH